MLKAYIFDSLNFISKSFFCLVIVLCKMENMAAVVLWCQ